MLPRHVLQMLAGDGYRPAHPAARGTVSEADYAGLRVRVMSATKARAYTPGAREVAISIRGPGEPEVQLSSRFTAVLTLVFPNMGIFAAPSSEGTGANTLQTITAAQAASIAAFVRAHRDASVLAIHCTAGVSRSRSAAATTCAALDLPYEFCAVNEDVYRAVLHAFSATAHAE